MPNSAQSNACNAALSTGNGVLYDQLGNICVVGAQMPTGAAAGKVVMADAAGNFSWGQALRLTATTGPSGYSLVNSTGTIISWAVPNDGLLHSIMVIGTLHVTVNETGGQLAVSWTLPDSTSFLSNFFTAAQTASSYTTVFTATVKAGSTVSVTQNTALTAGTATAWAEIWGG